MTRETLMDTDSSRTFRIREALGLDDPRLAGLLMLLWTTALAYIALHLSNFLVGLPESPLFDIGLERGYAEVFFQMLTGWTILLLIITSVRRHAVVFAVWAAAGAYLLLDDYFTIHERIGGWFALTVHLSAHLGEVLWLGAIGAIILAGIAVAYRLARPDIRRITLIIAALFGALAFFGVLVDALHAPFRAVPLQDMLFTTLEDGGEILVMCLLVVYLASLAFPAQEHHRRATHPHVSAPGGHPR